MDSDIGDDDDDDDDDIDNFLFELSDLSNFWIFSMCDILKVLLNSSNFTPSEKCKQFVYYGDHILPLLPLALKKRCQIKKLAVQPNIF